MTTIYTSLLTSKRCRDSTFKDRNIITEAESDRGRLLFCAAFRRLQQKAQVFSMEPNAAVRSRLTHSLEVSQMGRYIADLISKKLNKNGYATTEECTALVTFVEAACLMHDIGNPPFGHFGEAAIATWFRENGHNAIISSCSKNKDEIGFTDPRLNVLDDFFEFDGNPQGLRVVTKLQRNTDEYGLNLTLTTLASYLKYVRSSGKSQNENELPFTKKCGYFKTEAKIIKDIWDNFKYTQPQRFPLAYIMEAADDLAYCISDLEDSIEKGLLDFKNTFTEIRDQWNIDHPTNSLIYPDQYNFIKDLLIKASNNRISFIDFRTQLNREIVLYCATRYIEEHNLVLKGKLESLMDLQSPLYRFLNVLKQYCRKNVYCHESVQRIELAGYSSIYGLLEKFNCLLSCSFERFQMSLSYTNNNDNNGKPIIVEKKLLTLFPKNYIKVYQDDLNLLKREDKDFRFEEWSLRAHLVTDFLSGMTDDYAMSTYRTLSGMRL